MFFVMWESLAKKSIRSIFVWKTFLNWEFYNVFFVSERVWLKKAAGAFLLLSLGSIFASGRVQNDNSESFFMLAVANKLIKFYFNKKDIGQFCKINNNLIDPWI